jgi:Bacterial Ig domain
MNDMPSTPDAAAARHERRRFLLSAVGLATAGTLLGCGGSGDPPTIELSAIPQSGAVGETITLSADADDDDGLKEVRFYRVSTNAEELLATFTAGPYLLQTTIPTGASGTVSYMARAIDNDDEETDSTTVEVTVTT